MNLLTVFAFLSWALTVSTAATDGLTPPGDLDDDTLVEYQRAFDEMFMPKLQPRSQPTPGPLPPRDNRWAGGYRRGPTENKTSTPAPAPATNTTNIAGPSSPPAVAPSTQCPAPAEQQSVCSSGTPYCCSDEGGAHSCVKSAVNCNSQVICCNNKYGFQICIGSIDFNLNLTIIAR